ncbi:TolC family protein [Candidatus Nitrospira bockiana]
MKRLRTAVVVTLFIAGVAAPPVAVADLAGGTAASPSPELRLSLREAMEAAVDNNPNVRLFRERIEAARAASVTQLGALLPNVSSTVRQTQQTLFLGTLGLAPVRTDAFSIFDARANLTQSLFSLSLIQRWKASREALKVAELEAETTKFDTMATVGLLYVEALKAQSVAKTKEANVALFGELLELVRGRRGGGMATGLDTARLEAQLENERQLLSQARFEAERLLLSLIHALGISFDVKLVLTDELKLDGPEVPDVAYALETAMANRVEVKAQAQRIRTASLTLNSTTSERLPSLSAQGDYGLIGNRMHNTLDTYNIGVFLSVPLFDGGQREGRISETRSQVRQESIKMQVVSNQVALEVREAIVTLTGAKEQLAIAQSGLQAAMSELALARERFAVLSAGSNLELTNALYSLARARDNSVEALFRLNAARVNLARGTGKLDALF